VSYKVISTNTIGHWQATIHDLTQERDAALSEIRRMQENALDDDNGGPAIQAGGQPSELLQALQTMRERMGRMAAEEANRQWSMDGLAKFGDILRQNVPLREKAAQVVRQLVKCLDAGQGGFFLYRHENGEEFLELIACHAYQRDKFLENRIHVDNQQAEGLVGQAFLERGTIHLTDIPQNYTRITSGLGDATPTHLLIVPVSNDEGRYGVLELASFLPFQEHKVAFVEKLAESIASAVGTALQGEQTQGLLAVQARQQHELMRKEDELRQNLEEINASNEDLKQAQRELQYTFEAVDACFLSVELSPDGHILKTNAAFDQLMGYAENEINGQHHRVLANAEHTASDEYRDFWDQLRQGVFLTGEYMRLTKQGEKVWLRATYYPLKDQHGRVTRIIKLGYDITQEKLQQAKLAEQQRMLAENDVLLRERTKSVQDKAYQRIKDLKRQFQTELDEKTALIEQLTRNRKETENLD